MGVIDNNIGTTMPRPVLATAKQGAAVAVWVAVAVGWLAGVALQLQQAALQPATSWVWLLGGALLLVVLAWSWRRRWPAVLLLGVAAGTCAFVCTEQRAAWRLTDALPAHLEGQDLVVTGTVAELPRTGPSGTRFVLQTESASLRGQAVTVPSRLALGWYRSPDDDTALSGPPEELRAGQRWRLAVRLKQPHGSFNPHGFDLELWLFEQGIGASGSVRARPDLPTIKLAENTGQRVERLRQWVRDGINQRVADPALAGVLAALAIGDQAAIDREGWDLFRITGVAHLMSISGLHVTMLAWLAGAAVARVWRLQPRCLLWWPAPTMALWAGWCAAALYSWLAGWGVPAQRTVWMIGTVVLLRSSGARWPLHAVLLAAAFVVSLFDPWALLQPGFWLSFVAVALLVASEPVTSAPSAPVLGWWPRTWQAMRAGLRTQAVATLGLAPMTLVFFQQLSLVGFAANLLAIPVVTLLITPLALLGVLLPPLWGLAALIVQGLGLYLKVLAALPGASWSAGVAPTWAMAAGLLAGVLVVLPLPWRLRVWALPLALPLLMPHLPRPPAGHFELQAADIGQGTAVLLRTQNHVLLFDTGPQYSAEADAGGRVLLPLLRVRGEKQVDLLMLSHRDSDHIGGAATLLAALPVRAMSSSLTPEHPLLARTVPHRRCEAGQSWLWDGVRFDVLHPTPQGHEIQSKANSLSCVLRVQGLSSSALLTGDIEAAEEAALLQRGAAALDSDILIVPHHGSRTSSTAAFLDAVKPRVAVVQAAYRSRYGHPAPDVMARYAARGIKVVRSDQCGAWTYRSALKPDAAPDAAPEVCERQAARRYWHHQVVLP
jgi:competence protein ComEC